MARANKANTQSSRLKVITVGNDNRTLTLPESGATVIFTAAVATTAKTITLPAVTNVNGAAGAYFRFIWGVASDALHTIIQSSTSTELIKGSVLWLNPDGSAEAGTDVQADGSGHYILTVNDNIEPGTMVELVSDGSHWYVANSKVIATLTPAWS